MSLGGLLRRGRSKNDRLWVIFGRNGPLAAGMIDDILEVDATLFTLALK